MASALSLSRETRATEGEGSEPGGLHLHLGHSGCCAENRHNWERKGGDRMAGWKIIPMEVREPNVERGKPRASEPWVEAGSVLKVELPEFLKGST